MTGQTFNKCQTCGKVFTTETQERRETFLLHSNFCKTFNVLNKQI